MPRRIVIIQGHPDPAAGRYGHALASAYEEGARDGGHELRIIDVAGLDFPLLRSEAEFNDGNPPDAIKAAQEDIAWANHLIVFYPLWLGTMPALLKGFLEQAIRPGFAIEYTSRYAWRKLLKGRSARIVVTMGMPALIYRWFYGAHSLRSLERNILKFCGIGPIRESVIGSVGVESPRHRRKWLARMSKYGRRGV
ncbi:MAG: NAD(P)H-dependent oxidoreductase [Proteobacteria bacterium]|nr:NAD(P)H-dependent oxidoreductase [Pseudomonadota bacterium]